VKHRNLIARTLSASPIIFLVALLTAALPAHAQDKTITTRDGSCSATVPASWVVGSFPGSAGSADKKASVIISSPRYSSFATFKDNARKVYANDKVTKDSATEFEMEGKTENGKPNVYRGVAAGSKLCIGEVIYESGTTDDARKILSTLKAK
jgi:hypothetical protein